MRAAWRLGADVVLFAVVAAWAWWVGWRMARREKRWTP